MLRDKNIASPINNRVFSDLNLQGACSILILIVCIIYIYAVFGVIAMSDLQLFPGTIPTYQNTPAAPHTVP